MPLRFSKFVFVGCLGTVVQLTTLALLIHAAHVALLPATFASVEAALLQNFFWHERYTWPDRTKANAGARLLRFHLANGVISLAGNALLSHFLVARLRFPTLLSALIAVAVCGLANFELANRWVYRSSELEKHRRNSRSRYNGQKRSVDAAQTSLDFANSHTKLSERKNRSPCQRHARSIFDFRSAVREVCPLARCALGSNSGESG